MSASRVGRVHLLVERRESNDASRVRIERTGVFRVAGRPDRTVVTRMLVFVLDGCRYGAET